LPGNILIRIYVSITIVIAAQFHYQTAFERQIIAYTTKINLTVSWYGNDICDYNLVGTSVKKSLVVIRNIHRV